MPSKVSNCFLSFNLFPSYFFFASVLHAASWAAAAPLSCFACYAAYAVP